MDTLAFHLFNARCRWCSLLQSGFPPKSLGRWGLPFLLIGDAVKNGRSCSLFSLLSSSDISAQNFFFALLMFFLCSSDKFLPFRNPLWLAIKSTRFRVAVSIIPCFLEIGKEPHHEVEWYDWWQPLCEFARLDIRQFLWFPSLWWRICESEPFPAKFAISFWQK